MIMVKNVSKDKSESLRRAMLKPVSMILRAAFFVSGVTFHLEDVNKSGEKAPIQLMVPHTSFMDLYPALISFSEVPSFVSRKEALDFPFLGNLLGLMGAIYVQRETDARKQAISMMLKSIDMGRTVAICPEATYTNRTKLIRFKVGAFATGLPVQPCLISFNFAQYDSASFTCDGPGYFKLVWLGLCQAFTQVKCTQLPVYTPSDDEKSDPQLYAENVRQWISQVSGIPTSPYIFDDVFFLNLAKKCHLPRSPLCIKLIKLAYRCTPECATRSDVKLAKNSGIKAEDSNMLFRGIQSEHKKQATLTTLKIITSKLLQADEESWLNASDHMNDAIQRILNASSPDTLGQTNGNSLSNCIVTEKSAVIREIRECVAGKSLDQHTLVTLAAVLCDPDQLPWDRVHKCCKFLLRRASTIRPSSQLSKSQWQGLLWVLLGLEKDQIERINTSSDLTWQFLRTDLVKLFPQAVSENAPCLL